VATVSKALVFSRHIVSRAGIVYLITLFVAGFVTNFIPVITFNTGTLLLFSLAFFLSLLALLQLLNPLPRLVGLATFATLAVTGLMVLKAASDSNPLSQRVQELGIYFLGGWPFLFFVQVDDSQTRERFMRTLAIGLFCLCVFGIVQSVLNSSLPVKLFLLRGDGTFTVSEDQWRPTGLTGNPITFSSILTFASALFFALWLEKRRFRFLLALLCSFVANYLTYSRASLALLVPVLVVVWLLHHRFRRRQVLVALLSVALIATAAAFLLFNATDLLIVQILTNSSEGTQGSTLGHLMTIQDAREVIAGHPLSGVGVGSQGNSVGPENAIITDGAWWILMLEFGVPLSIVFVVLLVLVLIPVGKHVLRRDSKQRTLAIATLAFHAYLFPASFINSGILGHITFGLYWAVLGLSIAAASNRTSRVIAAGRS
jgi:O-Antigen ligase